MLKPRAQHARHAPLDGYGVPAYVPRTYLESGVRRCPEARAPDELKSGMPATVSTSRALEGDSGR